MAANKFYGNRVRGLFFLLAGVLLLAVMAQTALANNSDDAAWVFIPDQPVDVDGDGQEERFGSRFTVKKDGTVVGSAVVRDEEGRIVYRFSSGEIVNDIAGQLYLLLDGETLNLESQRPVDGPGSFKAKIKSNAHSDTLLWANDGNDFELQGQMTILVNPCSVSWLDWVS